MSDPVPVPEPNLDSPHPAIPNSSPPSTNIAAIPPANNHPNTTHPSKARVKRKRNAIIVLCLLCGSGLFYLWGDNTYNQAAQTKVVENVPYVVWYARHYNWSNNMSISMIYGNNITVNEKNVTLLSSFNIHTFRNEIKLNFTNPQPELAIKYIEFYFTAKIDYNVRIELKGHNQTYCNLISNELEFMRRTDVENQELNNTDFIDWFSLELTSPWNLPLNVSIGKIRIYHEERDIQTYCGPDGMYCDDPFLGG